MNLSALIMAGGRGTRFWPASRASHPKQLLSIVGPGSMLTQTARRLTPLVSPRNTFVVTAEDQRVALLPHVPQLGPAQVVAEPAARNTAPAIALALGSLLRDEYLTEDTLLAVLPADAWIRDEAGFRTALQVAGRAAEATGSICTIGICPTHASTGYGYLELDGAVQPSVPPSPMALRGFVEKPDSGTAEAYLESGRYLWNAGIFVFRVRDMIRELEVQVPDLYRFVGSVASGALEGEGLAAAYAELDKTSIDYAVMEGADSLQTVPGDFGWSDVGSWSALLEVARTGSEGAVECTTPLLIDSRDNVVHAPGRTVALLGVEGLVVVDTGDCLMVTTVENAQEVRRLRDLAQQRGHDHLT